MSLVYLFGDRLVGRLSVVQRLRDDAAVEIPSSGALVHLPALERHLLPIALWSLLDQELLVIKDSQESRRAWSRGPRYRLQLRVDYDYDRAENLPGLEGEFFRSLRRRRPWLGLDDLIAGWVAGPFIPINALVAVAQREAMAAGLLKAVHERRLPRSLAWAPGKQVFRAVPGILGLQEAAYIDLARRLATFQADHAAEWGRLFDESGYVLRDQAPPRRVEGGL